MTYLIRWIVYPRVVPIDTVETERVEETDLDKLVDECAARLDEVRPSSFRPYAQRRADC